MSIRRRPLRSIAGKFLSARFLALAAAGLLLVAVVFLLGRIPARVPLTPAPAPSRALPVPRQMLLAAEGLLFERGVTRRDLDSGSAAGDYATSVLVAPDFPLDTFRAELQKLAPTSGYVLAEVTGDDPVTILLAPAEPAAGAPSLTILLARRRPAPEVRPRKATQQARVAIVIDDIGLQRDLAERAASLPAAVTLAVMPLLPLSFEAARIATSHGKEVLLHLPMEPLDYPAKDPGPGALLASMPAEEMRRTFEAAAASVPGAVGLNNHMGSRFTADAGLMDLFLGFVNPPLFFLDSRTAPNSVAFERARARGLKALRRDVFLDNIDEPEAIRAQVQELLRIATLHGTAVGIGHPRENTLLVLAESIPLFARAGVEIVKLSRLAR